MRPTAFLLLLVLIGCDRPAQSQQPQSVDAPLAQSADARTDAANDEIYTGRRTAITRAVEAASPAVVSVNVIELRNYVRRANPIEEFFYGRRIPDQVVQQQVQGLGSGFVISPDGYIVTNDHVAGNATKITVAFPDGKTMDAQLIGSDPETDIALIKVTPEANLPFLDFETREDAIAGEWAIALGNPFGLFEAAEPSVTVGVVSAVGRDFPMQEGRTFRDMIQTDAAINSGNSGGPLVDATGRVLGMNTFIFSRSGGSVGIGFAVPAWRIQRVVEELRTSGEVNRSFDYGAVFLAIDPTLAQRLGLDEPRGLIVRSVDSGGPADSAGLKPYDLVLRVEGEMIGEVRNARNYLQDRFIDNRAGDTVTLGIVRDGREIDVELTLGTAE